MCHRCGPKKHAHTKKKEVLLESEKIIQKTEIQLKILPIFQFFFFFLLFKATPTSHRYTQARGGIGAAGLYHSSWQYQIL